MRCNHIYRVKVHESVVIGGASVGRCENEALPGMTKCIEHAGREAMGMAIVMRDAKISEMKTEIKMMKEQISALLSLP